MQATISTAVHVEDLPDFPSIKDAHAREDTRRKATSQRSKSNEENCNDDSGPESHEPSHAQRIAPADGRAATSHQANLAVAKAAERSVAEVTTLKEHEAV